jgi:hypothetical protein
MNETLLWKMLEIGSIAFLSKIFWQRHHFGVKMSHDFYFHVTAGKAVQAEFHFNMSFWLNSASERLVVTACQG